MEDTALTSVLDTARTVAVVGLSADPRKASHQVARILLDTGYDVIPVHPTAPEILGKTAYPSLAEIPVPVDVVDVFRPAEEAHAIARSAVQIGAAMLWLQLGITSAQARSIAESGGLLYVEDTCIGAKTRQLGNQARAT